MRSKLELAEQVVADTRCIFQVFQPNAVLLDPVYAEIICLAAYCQYELS